MKAFVIFWMSVNSIAALMNLVASCYYTKPVKMEYERGHFIFRVIWHLGLGGWALWLFLNL